MTMAGILESPAFFRRPETAFADDKFVSMIRSYQHDRLDDAHLGDGSGKFLQLRLVEELPRLRRIRSNEIDRNIGQSPFRPSFGESRLVSVVHRYVTSQKVQKSSHPIILPR